MALWIGNAVKVWASHTIGWGCRFVLTGQSTSVRPARVVILGAGGFLAARLRKDLEGDRISTLAIGSKELDLTDVSAPEKLASVLQRDDSIVFISALTPDRGRDVATLMKNLRMGEHVCAALTKAGCAHLVYMSSDAVYDGRLSLINEASPCEPADFHGVMHLVREKMLAHACHASDTPLAILRPCAVYGAGDTHNSYGPNRFMKSLLRDGKIVLFGQGEEERDHVYVQDVIEVARLCLFARSLGILNVVSGKARSFHEVAQTTATVAARDVIMEMLPRTGPVSHRHFDVTALVKAFPSFRPTSLQDGLAKSFAEHDEKSR
jgi:UDP-glucose 4-epimerase